jgi:hypothetical protein
MTRMKKLRHSTIVLTSDTYVELFEEYEEELTERSAAAVPSDRKPPAGTSAHATLAQESKEWARFSANRALTLLFFEPPVGFEPTTFALQEQRSTS